MLVRKAILASAMTAFMASLFASTAAAENKVSYTGSSLAKDICRAVVQDDAAKLHRLLRSAKMNALYGYTFDAVSPEISGSFYCNDMNLEDFSAAMNAVEVRGYLASGGTYKAGETMTASN